MTTPTTNEPSTVPCNYDLWQHMHTEHGLTLLDSELSEIEDHSARVERLETELAAERDAKFRAIECAANALEDAQKWRVVADRLAKSCKLTLCDYCSDSESLIMKELAKYEEATK